LQRTTPAGPPIRSPSTPSARRLCG
jgi:hypothetical protein